MTHLIMQHVKTEDCLQILGETTSLVKLFLVYPTMSADTQMPANLVTLSSLHTLRINSHIIGCRDIFSVLTCPMLRCLELTVGGTSVFSGSWSLEFLSFIKRTSCSIETFSLIDTELDDIRPNKCFPLMPILTSLRIVNPCLDDYEEQTQHFFKSLTAIQNEDLIAPKLENLSVTRRPINPFHATMIAEMVDSRCWLTSQTLVRPLKTLKLVGGFIVDKDARGRLQRALGTGLDLSGVHFQR